MERRRDEDREGRDDTPSFERPTIIGLADVMRLVQKVAAVEASVLITGGTGTGKELVAKEIHALSGRHDGPFVVANCAAIPEHLAESIFFGHTRGAFTGATSSHEGRFAAANGGTLFLDEIGDMPPALQAKLLRALQDGKFVPVGSSKEQYSDCRVISATNRNLAVFVQAGKFREDLLYRLNTFEVALPQLRDRPHDDIKALVHFFIKKHGSSKGVTGISNAAMDKLLRHSWPGNVRELENVIQRACIVVEEGAEIDEVAFASLKTVPEQDPALVRGLTGLIEYLERISDGDIKRLIAEVRKRGGFDAVMREIGGVFLVRAARVAGDTDLHSAMKMARETLRGRLQEAVQKAFQRKNG